MKKVRRYLYESLLKINSQVIEAELERISTQDELINDIEFVDINDYYVMKKVVEQGGMEDFKNINEEMLKEILKIFLEKFDKGGAFYKDNMLQLFLVKNKMFRNKELMPKGNISEEFEKYIAKSEK